MYNDRKRIDKNGYVVIEMEGHHRSFDTGTGIIGVYEHVLVAENMLGRRLLEGEVVHHLDCNRSNNSPDNLFITNNPMHGKLHAWMNRNVIIPKPEYQERIKLGCVRCSYCEIPIEPDNKYCSQECCKKDSIQKSSRPSKEELESLVNSKSFLAIGRDFGVSDNAVRKWCKSYGIESRKKKVS